MTEHATNLDKKLNRRSSLNPTHSVHEGWKAIELANKIFGPGGWSREIHEMRCAASRDRAGVCTAAYVARIRLRLRLGDTDIIREAHGCGEGRADTPFEAHDRGLKAAELDATLRAFATLGKAFGLTAFIPNSPSQATSNRRTPEERSPDVEADQDTDSNNNSRRPAPPPSPEPTQNGMALPKQPRQRSPAHLAYVRRQPCLVCGRSPVDAHHIKFAQPKAMSRKVSDEFTVPLCRHHHDQLHRDPDEQNWWAVLDIDPLAVAAALWEESANPELEGSS